MTKEEILSMPAGPEMDALVAELVMGWARGEAGPFERWQDGTKMGTWYVDGNGDYYECSNQCDTWRPSTDIAAAWQVVEKLRMAVAHLRHFHYETRAYTEAWWAKPLGTHTDSEVWFEEGDEASGETALLAICRAALLATAERLSE